MKNQFEFMLSLLGGGVMVLVALGLKIVTPEQKPQLLIIGIVSANYFYALVRDSEV